VPPGFDQGWPTPISHYLIRLSNETPNITLHTGTEITSLEGETAGTRGVEERRRITSSKRRDAVTSFLITGPYPSTTLVERLYRAATKDSCEDRALISTLADLPARRVGAVRPPQSFRDELAPDFASAPALRNGQTVAAASGEGSACGATGAPGTHPRLKGIDFMGTRGGRHPLESVQRLLVGGIGGIISETEAYNGKIRRRTVSRVRRRATPCVRASRPCIRLSFRWHPWCLISCAGTRARRGRVDRRPGADRPAFHR